MILNADITLFGNLRGRKWRPALQYRRLEYQLLNDAHCIVAVLAKGKMQVPSHPKSNPEKNWKVTTKQINWPISL